VSKFSKGVSIFQGLQLKQQECQYEVNGNYICQRTQKNTTQYNQADRYLSEYSQQTDKKTKESTSQNNELADIGTQSIIIWNKIWK